MPTIRTGDVTTYYERRGDGPSVVFVHGAIVDHGQWEPQMEALSDEYTVVAYDVRGHGRTGGSDRESYSVDLFADDLAALVEALDLDRPVVCGLSLGGAVAQAYATRYPDRLSGLVLADTFTPGDWRWPERLQWAMLRGTVLPARLVGYERVERAMVWFQERVRGEEASGDYERIGEVRAGGPRMTTDEFAKVVEALVQFPETDIDLSTVAVPTLVVYGEHEMGFVKRHAALMAASIPGARVVEVPDGAHASNLDNPAFFTEAVRAFLAEREDRRDASTSSGDDSDATTVG
ncbi:alpha/beta fold hydrolase [Halomarina litorea]|uniref:alpha/beta fold hydrolase n=1 Tax=Halomarina litorea TaxID=2961595 RepID=UPI0020C319AC|nr:alpha/beta hydrolase [Halomarina sp. BCD28]